MHSEAELSLTLEYLASLSPEELLKALDTGWPWPLDAVQAWFEDLWNMIITWVQWAASQVYSTLKPVIDNVWNWIKSWVTWLKDIIWGFFLQLWDWLNSIATSIVSQVGSLVNQVWSWLQSVQSIVVSNINSIFIQLRDWVTTTSLTLWGNISAYLTQLGQSIQGIVTAVTSKVSEINAWFSNEFIDPFLDWLLQFPSKFWEAFTSWWAGYWTELVRQVRDPTSPLWITWYALIGIAILGVIAMGVPVGAAVIGAVRWGGGLILSLWSAIGGWLAAFFGNLGIWIELYAGAFGTWLLRLLPRIGGWFLSHAVPLLGAGGIITLEATGQLNTIISNYVTPAITSVFDWAESMGPVSPMPGRDMAGGITRLAEFTISGLAAMTLAGEFLSPLKHLGLGHISAILYDLINYKTLTAAFMGVLAFVYVRQPLTYYYQKIARPNIPDERMLGTMTEQRVITTSEYKENMQWQGYPDHWIEKIADTVYRPMTPYLLRSLAEAGLLNENLLDHALKQAGYDDISIPYIKQMMNRLAATALASASSSTAMTRYKEGFDDYTTLNRNLTALGIAPEMLPRYGFAAWLSYLYDYQSDLKAFYIDQYHRRDIEEPKLRSSLASIGLLPERLDLAVEQQRIKRLAAPKPVEPPELAVQFDTIRDRRRKNLIDRNQEVEQLIKIGKELPYAIAIADNDDVALAEKAVVVAPKPVPLYETEEGKIRTDTIRRLRRQRQILPEDEIASLLELEMPKSLAQAISDNDELRLRKEAGGD